MFTGRCEIDTAKIQHIFKYFAKKMQIFSKKQISPTTFAGEPFSALKKCKLFLYVTKMLYLCVGKHKFNSI